jgi:D-alanine-D-alanine ligase
MLLKKIHTQDIAEVDAILPIIKIEKTIEIIIVPNSRLTNNEQANIGFVIDEEKILRILTERYQNVSITEINCEENLEELVKRKPDLVFSGVKYFFLKTEMYG